MTEENKTIDKISDLSIREKVLEIINKRDDSESRFSNSCLNINILFLGGWLALLSANVIKLNSGMLNGYWNIVLPCIFHLTALMMALFHDWLKLVYFSIRATSFDIINKHLEDPELTKTDSKWSELVKFVKLYFKLEVAINEVKFKFYILTVISQFPVTLVGVIFSFLQMVFMMNKN